MPLVRQPTREEQINAIFHGKTDIFRWAHQFIPSSESIESYQYSDFITLSDAEIVAYAVSIDWFDQFSRNAYAEDQRIIRKERDGVFHVCHCERGNESELGCFTSEGDAKDFLIRHSIRWMKLLLNHRHRNAQK